MINFLPRYQVSWMFYDMKKKRSQIPFRNTIPRTEFSLSSFFFRIIYREILCVL